MGPHVICECACEFCVILMTVCVANICVIDDSVSCKTLHALCSDEPWLQGFQRTHSLLPQSRSKHQYCHNQDVHVCFHNAGPNTSVIIDKICSLLPLFRSKHQCCHNQDIQSVTAMQVQALVLSQSKRARLSPQCRFKH
jgi:hypothetical protein